MSRGGKAGCRHRGYRPTPVGLAELAADAEARLLVLAAERGAVAVYRPDPPRLEIVQASEVEP